ncbi:MAG: type I-C CRISPR-associated endonuclease Cas1 [Candidatus Aminicenantes bacterium]|nr:type I-C CRISPR-associated endonuclease Cas1 [Candidatus Aminicenantes bacterium]
MKKLLNTLYVVTAGAYAHRERQTVCIEQKGVKIARIPVHTLESIVVFGHSMISPGLLELCAESGVLISFLKENGRFIARVCGPQQGNVLLRRTQYRWADCEKKCLNIARPLIQAKILNSRTVLKRVIRDHQDSIEVDRIKEAVECMARIAKEVAHSQNLDHLRGLEGDAARQYFGVFDQLIVTKNEGFGFYGRNRRPPKDPVNSLLSYLYSLLLHDVRSALEGVGLDPAVGFLHRDRPGRMGLALDIMEELRVMLADRVTLSLINRKQVSSGDFKQSRAGGVTIMEKCRKIVLIEYQKRKHESIRHPFLEETIELGLLPHAQALLLSRYIRGDLDGYPPFIWR